MQYITTTYPGAHRSTETSARGPTTHLSSVLWSSVVNKIRNKRRESGNNSWGNRIGYIEPKCGDIVAGKEGTWMYFSLCREKRNQKCSRSPPDSATLISIPVQLAMAHVGALQGGVHFQVFLVELITESHKSFSSTLFFPPFLSRNRQGELWRPWDSPLWHSRRGELLKWRNPEVRVSVWL